MGNLELRISSELRHKITWIEFRINLFLSNPLFMKKITVIFFCGFISLLRSQVGNEINELKKAISFHENSLDSLNSLLEDFQLDEIQRELTTHFLPKIDSTEKLIYHDAMCLVYDEDHEQAKWVLHKISNDIIDGKVSRTNDFRVDPLIESGSAEEKDYFLKIKLNSGKYDYDGFGYDRGHLAPSADFRWSQKALSESYFYSNMSPQLPSFNREKWAELEGLIRSYIFENNRPLIVYTGPVLHDQLAKVSRSINGVSIPEQFFKIVIDYEIGKTIAYLVPQNHNDQPVESFATTIDEIESLTGIDFLHQIEDEIEEKLESQNDISFWLPEKQKSDILPMDAEKLGRGRFNTIQARMFVDNGERKEICGNVVSTHLSKNDHTFINLDKSFPNQIFSITIWKSNRHNFSYQPHILLKNKKVCVKGKISENQGIPTMNLENEKSLIFID